MTAPARLPPRPSSAAHDRIDAPRTAVVEDLAGTVALTPTADGRTAALTVRRDGVAAIPLAAAGLLDPLASVFVVANSLRLRRVKASRRPQERR